MARFRTGNELASCRAGLQNKYDQQNAVKFLHHERNIQHNGATHHTGNGADTQRLRNEIIFFGSIGQ
eukprot:scaffold68940_cov52-Attheya_sp.AAC.1